MTRPHTTDLPATPQVLCAYGALLGVAGVALVGWGPLWFGVHLQELPYGRALLVRFGGTLLVAVALMAAGIATLERQARTRMLTWFIGAHAVVWLMLLLQIEGPIGDHPLAVNVAWTLMVIILTLSYLRFPTTGLRGVSPSLVDAPTGLPRDSAAFEDDLQRIREAAAQEERNRLARDLHDAVKQQIFAIQTSAAAAEARLPADRAGAQLALGQVRQSAREAMTEMEALLEQLRAVPIGAAGLVEAIRKHGEALAFRTGAVVDVQVGRLPGDDELPPAAGQGIFRIVQEALANVGRHARAHRVDVSIGATGGRLEIAVSDDGRGFDGAAQGGGMGVQNMRARAAELGGSVDLRATSGAGTVMRLTVPLITPRPQLSHRRQALGLALLTGVATMLLLIDLLQHGPRFGNAPVVIFGLLCGKHLQTFRRGSPATALRTPTGGEERS